MKSQDFILVTITVSKKQRLILGEIMSKYVEKKENTVYNNTVLLS